ncbi:MAG: PAS domain-containing protein [Acidobacteria bacterium]|nr:PAS domain-containing protein [Acidobacteriota bacterium]
MNVPRQETLPKRLLRLKKRTSWSWERMCREFHRVMGQEGPSHTTLFRYAIREVRRRNVLTERYVKEAIDKVTVELMHQELSENGARQGPVEKELRHSEIHFRELIKNAKVLIYRYRHNPPGCEYINPVVRDILGYTPEEFYADPELVLKIIHPEDKSRLMSALQNPDLENVTHRLIRKDGSVVWCEGVHVPIYDEAGHWIATEGISRGITERERATIGL